MPTLVPSMVQFAEAASSTSEEVRVPEVEGLPATVVPSSSCPASVTAPAASEGELVTTGSSFVPLTVIVMVCSA